MIAILIQLVIVLLIIGVIWWAINALMPFVPLPSPIPEIIRVLLIVILALVVIYYALIPLMHAIPHAGI